MKRTLSLLLVLVMVVTMIPNVFATTDKPGIDFDEMYYLDNYTPIEAEIAAQAEETFVWTATEAGTLTYEVPANVTVTLTQGDATATGTGTVALVIVAGEDVTITIANAAAEAVNVTLTGTLTEEVPVTPLVITKQPKDVLNAKENGNATFTVEATGEGTLSYQWQQSTDGGKTWADIASANAASYKVAVTVDSTDRFRCVITDETGATVTSSSATYGVMRFTVQPVDAGVVYPNTWITLSVEAVGGDGELEYRWQKRRVEEGAKWTWTGSYGATAEFKTSKWTHYEYRCRAMDSKYVYIFSDAAGWTKKDSILTITEEPVYVKGVAKGDPVTFSVVAESDCEISYVWYRKNKGKDTFTATSIKTASFTVTAQTYAEHEYYCVVTDEHGGRKQSKTVSFRTRTKDLIVTQPSDVYIATQGDSVTFDATATSFQGTVTYQWQKSKNGGASWFNASGATGATYTFAGSKGNMISGSTQILYRCVVTDAIGEPYYTAPVTFYVGS